MLLCWCCFVRVMDIIANLRRKCGRWWCWFTRCVRTKEKQNRKIMRHDWSNTTSVSSCLPPLFSNSPYDGMHCAVSFTNTDERFEFPIVQSGTNNKGYQFKWLVVFRVESEKAKQQRPSPFCEVPSGRVFVCWPSFEGELFYAFYGVSFFSIGVFSISSIHITDGSAFWRREESLRKKFDKKDKKLENFCGKAGKTFEAIRELRKIAYV